MVEHINHPVNALNLQSDVHDSMANNLAWGIEAKLSGNKVSSSISYGPELTADSTDTITES